MKRLKIMNIRRLALLGACFGLSLATSAMATGQLAGTKSQWSNQKQMPPGSVDLLVKLKSSHNLQSLDHQIARRLNNPSLLRVGTQVASLQSITPDWVQVKGVGDVKAELMKMEAVAYVQPNFRLKTFENPNLVNLMSKSRVSDTEDYRPLALLPDNPTIPDEPVATSGLDPLLIKQWGMKDNGVEKAWTIEMGSPEMVVAVIDTGVDYTHEDLLPNLWRNLGESGLDADGNSRATNGKDDDNNGFVDDVIGWDFASNDNRPYDLASMSPADIINGTNPGHGTHCAGNVAARGENGKGIAGVAPNVRVMSLRFITEKGYGTTADAVKAIHYAVDNGARILSNSWGGEGNPNDSGDQENRAMKEAVEYSEAKGVLFVVAAGNGRKGRGFDMDRDSKPVLPAAYDYESILSVAALDVNQKLGVFSNWGLKTVDIGAPGVNIFSTMVQQNYSNVVLDHLGIKANWDGTSMATPHVAGAAALYWSKHPNKTWQEVKAAIMKTAVALDSLKGKTVSGGKLNVENLLND